MALAGGIGCWVMAFMAARMMVMAVVGASSTTTLVVWMAVEYLAFFVARKAIEGSIRWNQAGLDGLGFRWVFNPDV